MVIEDINILKNQKFIELLHRYGTILLYENSHIEKRIINEKYNSIVRITTIQSLFEEIDFLEPKSFNYFLEKGLNKKCKEQTTLAIQIHAYTKKSLKEVIKFHCFNDSKLETINDIPLFYPDVPDGFSLFCSKLEYSQLMNYIKKHKTEKKKEKKQDSEENYILETEPAPNKKHYLCQICKAKFFNYKEHMNSILHCENRMKYKKTFESIKSTFKRIVDYNKLNKKRDNCLIKVIYIQESEDLKSNNISPMTLDINNNCTKEGSDSVVVINDENKDDNENKVLYAEKYIEKNEEVINLIENEEETVINSKDILNILNSIGSKISRNDVNFLRKRERNKKDVDYFDDIISGLKRFTGKINFFNELIEMNK